MPWLKSSPFFSHRYGDKSHTTQTGLTGYNISSAGSVQGTAAEHRYIEQRYLQQPIPILISRCNTVILVMQFLALFKSRAMLSLLVVEASLLFLAPASAAGRPVRGAASPPDLEMALGLREMRTQSLSAYIREEDGIDQVWCVWTYSSPWVSPYSWLWISHYVKQELGYTTVELAHDCVAWGDEQLHERALSSALMPYRIVCAVLYRLDVPHQSR